MSYPSLWKRFSWKLPVIKSRKMIVIPRHVIFCTASQILHLKTSIILADNISTLLIKIQKIFQVKTL